MRIVQAKPSTPATNESILTANEAENEDGSSFLDLLMAEGVSQETVLPVEEAAVAPQQDVAVLDKMLTELQQNVLPNNTLTAQSTSASEANEESVATVIITDRNKPVQNDETVSTEKKPEEPVNNTNKLIFNQKTMRSNQSSSSTASNKNAAISTNETNNTVSLEGSKANTQAMVANRNSEDVAKNQINEIATKNAITNSFTSHAMQRAVSATKSSSTSNFANEMLSANVAFHFENIDQVKEKSLGTGTHHININITPPELGPVSARLKMTAENRVELEILAKNNDVAQVIKSQLHALREQFTNTDIRLDAINVQTDDSLSENSNNKDSNYNQTVPVDYLNSAGDNASVLKVREKTQKTADTLIDAYI